jgi:hypothetical protein
MSLSSPKATFLPNLTIRLLIAAWFLLAMLLAVGLSGLFLSPAAMADESVTRDEIRKELNLVYNHPNPFNPSTTISYVLLQPAHVKVDVYDLKGRHVVSLVDTYQNDGENFAVWKTQTAPSGTYIFSLEADGIRVFRKMMLVR